MNGQQAVQNALAYIRSKPELVTFVRDFDRNSGFMFSSDPRVREIDDAVLADGHSGGSFEWCLRRCQDILSKDTPPAQ